MNPSQNFYSVCSKYIPKATDIVMYLALNRIITTGIYDAKKSFENAIQIEDEPEILLGMSEYDMRDCAKEIISYFERACNIYDYVENDLVKGSGYAVLATITYNYYAYGKAAERRININADLARLKAQRVAESKITGLSFGIISSSIADHIFYRLQNEAEIRRQTREAENYLSVMNAQIEKDSSRQLSVSKKQYYTSKFIPQMRENISRAYFDMLTDSVILLGKRNAIDIRCIQSFDFDRSQQILEKLQNCTDPIPIIETALQHCPYNVHAYAAAKRLGVYNENLQELAKSIRITDAIEKEIGFSMASSKDTRKIDIDIGRLIQKNEVVVGYDDWQRIAAQYVDQSKQLISEHPGSFAANGAYAVYLIAYSIEDRQPKIWEEAEKHMLLCQNLFFERLLTSGNDSKLYKAYCSIIDSFRNYCNQYFTSSYYSDCNDDWCCASPNKKWKITADYKRRLIPALQAYKKLIDLLEEEEAIYNDAHKDQSNHKRYAFRNQFRIDILKNDLLWFTYVFGSYLYGCDVGASGKVEGTYYHLPMNERNAGTEMYDQLSENAAVIVSDGWNKAHDRRKDQPDIFRSEICDKGKTYFGINMVKPIETNSVTYTTTSSKGCYIATCVYGSYDCPQVWTLRRFRDNVLEKTFLGRCFIDCYYTISPVLVKHFGKTKWFQKIWRTFLDEIVVTLHRKGIEQTEYFDN